MPVPSRRVPVTRLLVGVLVAGVVPDAPAQSAAQAAWAGWAQCVINTQGPGYANQQTQTWTTTGGAPAVQGAFRMHPATWSVSGSGSLQRTQGSQSLAAQWTTSVPAAGATISVLARASDGRRLIRTGHAQLRQRGGVAGTQTQTVGSAAPKTTPISAEAFEWAFPTIEDASPNPRIQGSTSGNVRGSHGFMQPAGSTTTASCTWDFAQGAAPSPVPQVVAVAPGGTVPGATPPATTSPTPPASGPTTAPAATPGSGGAGTPTGSSPSAGGSATPMNGAPTGSTATGTAAAEPTNVRLDRRPMIASLYWKGSPDAQRYRVWRSEPGKAPILVASNALNNVPDPTPTQVYFDLGDWWCQDTVPDPRITYSYTVTAYYPNGVTASAPAVSYVSPPLNNPAGFTATYDQANNAVNLAWQEPAMQLSYQLEGPGLPGGKIVNPTLSWSIYQPPAGTLTYKVTAIYPRGFADYATATVATVTVPR